MIRLVRHLENLIRPRKRTVRAANRMVEAERLGLRVRIDVGGIARAARLPTETAVQSALASINAPSIDGHIVVKRRGTFVSIRLR